MKAVKQFKAEIGHRLMSAYTEPCKSLHGHSYLFEITLEDEYLNKDGMVMDFGELKDKMEHFFNSFDHTFVVCKKDIILNNLLAIEQLIHNRLMIVDYNPTAENMAYHAFRACVENGLPVKEVRVQETLTGWAIASRPKPFVGEDITYYNIPERHHA